MIDETSSPAARDEARAFRRDTLGLLGAVLALVAAVTGGAAAAERAPVAVTVTATACEPMELVVPAGRTTFVVTNRSSRALEWEILQGVMVIDERENIAPGFKARLTTRLDPGTYEITCGLLDNPRGRLVVTATGTAPAAISAEDLIGPVAEYRVGTAAVLVDLAAAIGRLRSATAAGDRAAAKAALVDARALFLATALLRGVAESQAAAVEADLAALDRIDEGGEASDAVGAIARLEIDAKAHAAAVKPVVLPADRLIAAALAEARALAAAAEEAADAATLEARRAAIARVIDLFAPLAARRDPAAAEALAAALARTRTLFAEAATPENRRARAEAAAALADRLAGLPATLGL